MNRHQTEAAKRYEKSPKRRAYQRQYWKDHYRKVCGWRVKIADWFKSDLGNVWVTPMDFLVRKSATQPFTFFDKPNVKVYIPRPMVYRAKMDVKK